MVEVGGALLSAFLQVLIDRMASREFGDFLRGRKLNDGLLDKFKTILLSVEVVLEDAEDKQVTNPSVRKWLDELKHAVYDAEDVLDEIATKALQSKLNAEFGSTASKVRNCIKTSIFFSKIEVRIKEVLGRLENLASQQNVMGLVQAGTVRRISSERLPTTSLVEDSDICGRNDDKDEMIDKLLPDDASDNKIGVIAIVGMGGMGKTTLAQLVYNDNRVQKHFDLVAWVCVSEEFDMFKVTKTILEAERLMGKKFLLVLDDVWNKNYTDWEILSKPFKSGVQGSRIIITTRDVDVASAMRAFTTHHLKKLQEEDCWSLFARHAFHDANSYMHSDFEELGRKIVEKCEGLPLAIKTIGALLRSKVDVSEWDKVLNSEIWSLSDEEIQILPALRLSYKHLPSYIKRCFAYCSIFPKDYCFNKNELILLWMAEGLLHETENKTMEEIGGDYFVTLVSRSLFQKSSEDEFNFVMHDLINDLAKFVYGEFTFRLEVDSSDQIVNKTRHVSYVRTDYENFKKFEPLQEATQLRTFLVLKSSTPCLYTTKKLLRDGLLPMFSCLRVLSLSNYWKLCELPESIGKITPLRYLEISRTVLGRLPDSLCKLYNLQTLKLSSCTHLRTLPRDMQKLVNLRHLDFTGTPIIETLIHVGKLKCLQTLTTFVVSKRTGCSITELGKLANLRGALSILGLENVESFTDAHGACLQNKKYLEELALNWNGSSAEISESQRDVLNGLQPYRNLKSLTINYYMGGSFPNWVGNHSFSNVTSTNLGYCKYCCSLPALGQLASLQNLSIVGFDGIVAVVEEFYGSGSSYIKPFGALKVIKFEQMLNWEKWISFDAENEGGAFHLAEQHQHDLVALLSLIIEECPNFVSFPRGGLHATNLGFLEMSSCESLRSLPDKMHMLLPSLTRFHIIRCTNIEMLPEGWSLQNHASLRDLIIRGGSEDVVSFPEKGLLPTNLIDLEISKFPNLTLFDKKVFENLTSLETLMISDCQKLERMPEEGLQHLTFLNGLVIQCYPKLEGMLEEGLQHLTSLSILYIYECPLMKRRWKRRKGKEWRKLAHIPFKIVDDELIE
ncbi:hypothetical protein I3843_14G097400 [Carya illinoinensis]|nr:hypothetical protein I3843_14G097400 [Carya illinoinensis]